MRNFTCFTVEGNQTAVREALFIVAEDECRAQELARRELAHRPEPTEFEIREGGKLLCVGLAAC